MIDDLPVGYADAIVLLNLDARSRDDMLGMELRADGIYVREAPPEAIAGEAAALCWHPTGNLAEPAFGFPGKFGLFVVFLERAGLYGRLEPTRVARWAVERKLDALAEAGGLPGRWPWGAHETQMLKALAKVATKHWGNYNPADPSTATATNEMVKQELIDAGVSKRVAEAMATALRPDGLPRGPRR